MSELYHYGRPNQKWGIRNYQNRDGTWTELGKARRRMGDGRASKNPLQKTADRDAATHKAVGDKFKKALDSIQKIEKDGLLDVEEYESICKKLSEDPDFVKVMAPVGKQALRVKELSDNDKYDEYMEAVEKLSDMIVDVRRKTGFGTPDGSSDDDLIFFDAAGDYIYKTAGKAMLEDWMGQVKTEDANKKIVKGTDEHSSKVGHKAIGKSFEKADLVGLLMDDDKERSESFIKETISNPEYIKIMEPVKKQALIAQKLEDNLILDPDGFGFKNYKPYQEATDKLFDILESVAEDTGYTKEGAYVDVWDKKERQGAFDYVALRYLEQFIDDPASGVLDGLIHSSLEGGSMYVKDSSNSNALIHSGTLILGDSSSYLEHYGRPNQKWGIRNYQNYDGSLTPLGYIHYGYGKARKAAGEVAKATAKGVTGAAKTAHKIGEHVSVSMAKAKKKHKGKVLAKRRKAAIKKKEKLAKKKEKLSQTREDVIKNKDLFTTDELRVLNDRFDIEDRLKLKESAESGFNYDSKRLAKKKENAAKTREGVLKNKELFTTEELRALSQRFDVEDDISLGKVRKGAEIVGKVAENAEKVAKAVKAGGEAYSVLTGKAPLKGKKKDDKKDDEKENKAFLDNSPQAMARRLEDHNNYNMFSELDRTADLTLLRNHREYDPSNASDGLGDTVDYNARSSSSSRRTPEATTPSSSRNSPEPTSSSSSSRREPEPTSSSSSSGRRSTNAPDSDPTERHSQYTDMENAIIDALRRQRQEEEEYARRNRTVRLTHSGMGGATLVLTDGHPYIAHSGTKGMKRGVRNYQNRDGTWTELGKARRRKGELTERQKRKLAKKITTKKAERKYYEGVLASIESEKRLYKNVHTAVGATSGAIIAGSISAMLGVSAVVAAPAVASGALIAGGIGRGLSALESKTASASYKRKLKKTNKKIDKLETKLADG